MAKAVAEQERVFDQSKFDVKWLPVKTLIVKWRAAQRADQIPIHAKRIAGAFDPDKFGILVVTLPDKNGMRHIIDGDHRATAVNLLWGGEETVPCEIVPTQDPVRAAEIFLGRNKGRRVVGALDNFKVSVTAGDPDCTIINKVVRSTGYNIENSKKPGSIRAVGALGHAYRRWGPDILRDTLTVIQATWKFDTNAVDAPIIQAYSNLLGRYHQTLNYGRIVSVMRKRFAIPTRLLASVKAVREATGGTSVEVIEQILRDNYNRGLKTGQLN